MKSINTNLGIGQELSCPMCNSKMGLHFKYPEYIHGYDNYQSGFWNKGDAIRIPFWCENCGEEKNFFLLSLFHKGKVFIAVQVENSKDLQNIKLSD